MLLATLQKNESITKKQAFFNVSSVEPKSSHRAEAGLSHNRLSQTHVKAGFSFLFFYNDLGGRRAAVVVLGNLDIDAIPWARTSHARQVDVFDIDNSSISRVHVVDFVWCGR